MRNDKLLEPVQSLSPVERQSRISEHRSAGKPAFAALWGKTLNRFLGRIAIQIIMYLEDILDAVGFLLNTIIQLPEE
jgi:hypothetical protein